MSNTADHSGIFTNHIRDYTVIDVVLDLDLDLEETEIPDLVCTKIFQMVLSIQPCPLLVTF